MGFGTSVLNVATAGPIAVGKALADIIGNLDEIAKGVQAMNGEFVGMRQDIRVLNEHVVELRDAIVAVRGSVGSIDRKWDTLDVKLDDLNGTLANVDALANRFARFGKRAS